MANVRNALELNGLRRKSRRWHQRTQTWSRRCRNQSAIRYGRRCRAQTHAHLGRASRHGSEIKSGCSRLLRLRLACWRGKLRCWRGRQGRSYSRVERDLELGLLRCAHDAVVAET